MSSWIDRISTAAGVENLADILGRRLPLADLQSLLHEVYRQQAARRTPAQVLAEYERSRLFGAANAAALHAVRGLVERTIAPDFEVLELSPVTPLGTSSAVAPVSPDWSVAALHGSEVMSDPTNVLALEAALRRRALLADDPRHPTAVHLAAMPRVVRPQRFANPKFVAHFALLGLLSSGRDGGNLVFEQAAIARHVGAHLKMLRAWLGDAVVLTGTWTAAGPADPRVLTFAEVCAAHGVAVEEEAGRPIDGYYKGFCFHLFAVGRDGAPTQLSDGGGVDWTARLLANGKERCFISGVGLEFLPLMAKSGS